MTCELGVGHVSSANGGATWTGHRTLAGPMSLSWLANTSRGRMVGDYISTSWAGDTAHPIFAVASAPVETVLNQQMVTPTTGLAFDGNEEQFPSEVWPEPGVQGSDLEKCISRTLMDDFRTACAKRAL